jgi:hypothetical protein
VELCTNSWPSIVGASCDLIPLVQVKIKCERSMPMCPPRCGGTSRLALRDSVADGIKCGLHGGKKSKMKSEIRSRHRVVAKNRSLRVGFLVVLHKITGFLG